MMTWTGSHRIIHSGPGCAAPFSSPSGASLQLFYFPPVSGRGRKPCPDEKDLVFCCLRQAEAQACTSTWDQTSRWGRGSSSPRPALNFANSSNIYSFPCGLSLQATELSQAGSGVCLGLDLQTWDCLCRPLGMVPV